uniref:Uncharacterized protein n=1 Tax=Lactuca sativa TaxID=4236 RepID=A0A9R1XM42_LACSA|nr:hypothetical protein LSAT_V11C300112530 [Lactuca sativa]
MVIRRDIGEEDDDESFDNNFQLPSIFSSIEKTNMINDNKRIVSQLVRKNYFTQEITYYNYQLHNIRTRKKLEVIETCPTLWTTRCNVVQVNENKMNILKLQSELVHILCNIWVLHLIVDNLGYTPSYKKISDKRQKTIEHVFGNREESYAFATYIKGFAYCWSMISINGQYLYGKYLGTLIIAMGVDGNSHILLLRMRVRRMEPESCFQNHESICLIYDRHRGILKVVNKYGSPWLEPRGFLRLAYRAKNQNQVRKLNTLKEIGKLNPQSSTMIGALFEVERPLGFTARVNGDGDRNLTIDFINFDYHVYLQNLIHTKMGFTFIIDTIYHWFL